MKSPTIRFSLWKAFASLAAFGLMFALTRRHGFVGVCVSIITGGAFTALLLLTRRADLKRVVGSYLWCLYGAVFAMLLMPHWPAYESAIVGAIGFWLIGGIDAHLLKRSHRSENANKGDHIETNTDSSL